MRLTVVGCSGSVPGPRSPASCYLLEAPYEGDIFRLLLDLGSGSFGHLQRYIAPTQVGAVALSHLHADHCLDLTAMYVQRKYDPAAPYPRLAVYGPPGTAARMARAYDLPERPGMTEVFEFREWRDGDAVRIGPFEVALTRMAHPVESYAMRVSSQGRVLTYSGDTGPCEGLVSSARGADVLLAEASLTEAPDKPADLHLTGREAGAHASRAGVGRLLLTHLPPWTDPGRVLGEAESSFEGPVELVEAGASYDI